MSTEARNRSVIEKAFARLQRSEEDVIRNGMYGLLNAGLHYLEEAHGLLHGGERHTEENNTLGWALVHDGNMLEVASHSGEEWTPYGDALHKLEDIARQTKGWVGIILSDMANDWYRVDYEFDYLAYSADRVQEHFNDYFKRI